MQRVAPEDEVVASLGRAAPDVCRLEPAAPNPVQIGHQNLVVNGGAVLSGSKVLDYRAGPSRVVVVSVGRSRWEELPACGTVGRGGQEQQGMKKRVRRKYIVHTHILSLIHI